MSPNSLPHYFALNILHSLLFLGKSFGSYFNLFACIKILNQNSVNPVFQLFQLLCNKKNHVEVKTTYTLQVIHIWLCVLCTCYACKSTMKVPNQVLCRGMACFLKYSCLIGCCAEAYKLFRSYLLQYTWSVGHN